MPLEFHQGRPVVVLNGGGRLRARLGRRERDDLQRHPRGGESALDRRARRRPSASNDSTASAHGLLGRLACLAIGSNGAAGRAGRRCAKLVRRRRCQGPGRTLAAGALLACAARFRRRICCPPSSDRRLRSLHVPDFRPIDTCRTAAYTFPTHKPKDNLSRRGASRAHHTPAPIQREAQTPLTVSQPTTTSSQIETDRPKNASSPMPTPNKRLRAPARRRCRQTRGRAGTSQPPTPPSRRPNRRRRRQAPAAPQRTDEQPPSESQPRESQPRDGQRQESAPPTSGGPAAPGRPASSGRAAPSGGTASSGGPAPPRRTAPPGRPGAPGRAGRRREPSRAGSQHHRAEGQEHPAAHADRQGSHRRRRDRHAQAGADLPDPQGADRAERVHLLRRRARSAAGRIRLPARARLQLPARPRRHLRLALADSQVRSADRRHGVRDRFGRRRKGSATSPSSRSRRSTSRRPSRRATSCSSRT